MQISSSFSPLSISLASVALSLVNLQNVFLLIASGVNTDASTWLLPSDLFHTYSQTYDHMANLSQSKQVFLCNPTCGLRESHHETLQAYFRLPQSRLQASTKRTYVRNTRPFSNGTPPSQLRTNWISIKWWTWLQLEHKASATRGYNVHIHIQLFSANLDESQEWPRGPSKSRNSSESRKIPISEKATNKTQTNKQNKQTPPSPTTTCLLPKDSWNVVAKSSPRDYFPHR